MPINFSGTWEQKENKTGNTGTKASFREQGTWEHKENFVGNKGTWTPLWEALSKCSNDNISRGFLVSLAMSRSRFSGGTRSHLPNALYDSLHLRVFI